MLLPNVIGWDFCLKNKTKGQTSKQTNKNPADLFGFKTQILEGRPLLAEREDMVLGTEEIPGD